MVHSPMPSVFAIVSKKVFESDAAGLGPGDVWKTGAYLSTHKSLGPLEEGGNLYLVTVRPPNEKLWLVAVLESPKKKKDGWHAKSNAVPITDLSSLRSKIVFSTGKGMSQKKGALGMSLQTPRVLAAADEQLLQAALGSKVQAAKKKVAKKTKTKAAKKKTAKESKIAAASAPASQPDGPIHYNEEARKYLTPRSADDLKAPKTTKALWKALRNTIRIPTDIGESLPAIAGAFAVLADAEEPEAIDAEAWAQLVMYAGAYNADRTLGYLVAKVGVVEGLKILIRAHDFTRQRGRVPTVIPATDQNPPNNLVQDVIFHGLLRADEDTRREALLVAEESYPGSSFQLRLALLAAFPAQEHWASELAKEWLASSSPPSFGRDALLRSVTDPKLIEPIVAKAGLNSSIIDVVPLLGVEAVPLLEALLSEKRFPNEQKALSRALACIATPASAAAFAKHLRKKNVRPFATEFYATHPELAPAALGELAKKRTKVGATAKEILERVQRSQRIAARIDREIADDADVPEILRNPPWHSTTRPKRKKPKVIEGLTVPEGPSHLHWPESSRKRRIARQLRQYFTFQDPEAARRELEEKLETGQAFYAQVYYPADRLLPLLESAEVRLMFGSNTPEKLLALYGERALPAVLRNFERERLRATRELIFRLESPRVAAGLLGHFYGDRGRFTAVAWIERYPEAAIAGLVPATLGASKKAERSGGETALRHLARRGYESAIRETAASYGEEAEAIVDALLAWDERWECPKKPPKMPTTFRPAELRPPKLKDGKALPEWAVERLGEMLRFSPCYPAYPGVAEVREACEPKSLAEFAWDLAQAWDTDGAKDSQILDAPRRRALRRRRGGAAPDACAERRGHRPHARPHQHGRGADGAGDHHRAGRGAIDAEVRLWDGRRDARGRGLSRARRLRARGATGADLRRGCGRRGRARLRRAEAPRGLRCGPEAGAPGRKG